MRQYNVGIVGATGSHRQRFTLLLENHRGSMSLHWQHPPQQGQDLCRSVRGSLENENRNACKVQRHGDV